MQALQDDLKDTSKENSDYAKTNAEIKEEERLLEKEMRGKNAQVAHLLKRVEELKAKLKEGSENYKTLKNQLTELEVKEQLESEEIAILKETIGSSIDSTDDEIEKELEDLKNSLKDEEDDLGGSDSGSEGSSSADDEDDGWN